MDYEQFNEAMTKLRQAQETLNMLITDLYFAVQKKDASKTEITELNVEGESE